MIKVKLPKDKIKFETRYFSAAQIGYLCNMSASSVFRAITDNKIKHCRTPGGHYRVERKEVVKFIKKTGITPGKGVMELIAQL